MGYFTAFFILCIGGLLGKVVIHYLKLQKTKHTLVYGLFAYFSGFFILSGPFTLLQLHWNLYSVVMTLYNLAIIGLLVYTYSKKMISVTFSFKAMIAYLRNNWLPLGMIFFFVFMNFASNNAQVGVAIGDDISYLSWAAKNIGHTIYPIRLDPVTGRMGKIDLLLFVSFLEMFWGYTSQLLHVDLIIFARTTMSIVTYFWFFYTVDELIYVMTDSKKYERFKYTILAAGLMYYVNGMQSEVYKFMYNPWFGNVFSLMMYLPLLLLFFWHSLTNKKALYLLLLLPFISAGFSPISILHAGLTCLPIFLLWYKNKTYAFPNSKKLVYISLGISVLFLLVSIFPNLRDAGFAIFTPEGLEASMFYSDMAQFQTAFGQRLPFMLPGIAIFFYRLSLKKVKPIEKGLVLFALSVLVISLMPGIDVALFVVFSFPYRRVLDGYMMALVFYSAAMILMCLPKITIPRLLGLFAVISLVFYHTAGFYFIDNKDFKEYFNVYNLLQEKRFPPAVNELEAFLRANAPEKTHVCIFGDRFFTPRDGGAKLDIAMAIAPVPNAYYNCELPANKAETFYYVTNDSAQLYQEVGREHLRLRKRIDTNQLTIEVYQYV